MQTSFDPPVDSLPARRQALRRLACGAAVGLGTAALAPTAAAKKRGSGLAGAGARAAARSGNDDDERGGSDSRFWGWLGLAALVGGGVWWWRHANGSD